MAYDFKQLKENADILDILSRYMTLKRDGPHYKGECQFHNEDTASLVVTPGKKIWKCFGCGAGGDVFDFLTNYGYTYKEAVAIVSNNNMADIGVPFAVKKLEGNTKAPKIWKQATPRSQPTDISHYRYGIPHAYWPYKDANGVIISYDCRFNHTDGTKDVLPFTYCTDGKDFQWRWQGMDKPRVLSNLPLLAEFPDKPVLICEGRKTADAVQRLLPNPIVMTWQGGGNAVQYTDWAVLKGRRVTIWQDNDYAGYKGAVQIADIIAQDAALIRFVHNPKEADKGWDGADAETEGWDEETTRDFIIKNAFDKPQVKEKPAQDELKIITPDDVLIKGEKRKPANVQKGEQANAGAVSSAVPGEQAQTVTLLSEAQVAAQTGSGVQETNGGGGTTVQRGAERTNDLNPHFRFLGFLNHDGKLHHCFYNLTTRTIIKMSASGMGKAANLIELAPLNYWETHFFKKDGFNHAAAVNYLICTSAQIGIFRHQNIRGRGAWMDAERSIIHAGDYLIVNGKYQDLSEYRGKYIYEQGDSLGFNASNPLDAKEAGKLLDLTIKLKWERNVDAYLLAGWCVIAPVCGALKWRPHTWITGGAGSGKTWVLDFIVKPMLGDTSLCVQGSTSEAGLRQALRRDALPVIFDEAEGENKQDQERMQSVLSLMRAASSEDGGNIIKGTSGGGADNYQIRSCFMFASIALQLSQQSDRTRISILTLKTPVDSDVNSPERKKHFDDLLFTQYNLITRDYCQRLQARTIINLPTIIKNARTFAAAAASVLGQQRAGDQLGALLAGAYSLKTDKLISYEGAIKWLQDKDWSQESALNETRDEHELFVCLMDTPLRVEGPIGHYERTVGELIRNFMELDGKDEHIAKGSAELSLRRFGINIDKETARMIISNSAKSLKKALDNTPWNKNHNTLLMRIPGAQKVDSVRFGSGVRGRGVSIPITYFVQ